MAPAVAAKNAAAADPSGGASPERAPNCVRMEPKKPRAPQAIKDARSFDPSGARRAERAPNSLLHLFAHSFHHAGARPLACGPSLFISMPKANRSRASLLLESPFIVRPDLNTPPRGSPAGKHLLSIGDLAGSGRQAVWSGRRGDERIACLLLLLIFLSLRSSTFRSRPLLILPGID